MSSNKHVIVAGGGPVGETTATLLYDRGHTVVLVERDPERSKALSESHVATVVNGDATQPDVLAQADVDRADAIAAMTSDPGRNLGICLLAQAVTDGIYTLVRTDREEQKAYTEHVDAVVLAQQCVANRTVDLLVGGEVRTFTGADGGFEVIDLAVAEGSSVADHTLDDVSLPDGCRVIAHLTAGDLAAPEMQFVPGDRYLLAVEAGTHEDVRMLFQE